VVMPIDKQPLALRKEMKRNISNILQLLNKSDTLLSYYYRPAVSKWIFILSFIIISLFYDFQQILFLRPQGLHQWRQCDGLSITMNYYKENLSFFNPAVHSMEADEGKSGHTISEFPLVYYLTGNIWKLTGHKEYIFRLIDLLLVFFGLFAFFRLCEEILKDSLIAMICSFILFSSPVLSYYSCNFIPNTSAFGLILIAWYFAFLYFSKNKRRFLFLSFLFFLLGGLIKITHNLSLLSLILVLIINIIKNHKDRKEVILRMFGWLALAGLILLIVFVYYYRAHLYNEKHHSGMFSFQLHPVWNLKKAAINEILHNFRTFWFKQYFSAAIQYLLAFSLVFILIYRKFTGRFYSEMLFFLLAGSLVYVIFWFSAMSNHDYYVIDLMISVCFLLLTFFMVLKSRVPVVFNHVLTRIILIILLIFSIKTTTIKVKDRYSGWMNEVHRKYYYSLETITPYLRSLGINRNDVVLSIPDPSFNITLYLMDQKGFTSGGSNTDSFLMERMFKCGLKYMIVNDSTIIRHPQIQQFTKKPMGKYHNIIIYDLREFSEQFTQ